MLWLRLLLFCVRCAWHPAVLGRGYNHSVDWWTLGVLMYVLLTARQPFSSPKTHDPMEVRGAAHCWHVTDCCVEHATQVAHPACTGIIMPTPPPCSSCRHLCPLLPPLPPR